MSNLFKGMPPVEYGAAVPPPEMTPEGCEFLYGMYPPSYLMGNEGGDVAVLASYMEKERMGSVVQSYVEEFKRRAETRLRRFGGWPVLPDGSCSTIYVLPVESPVAKVTIDADAWRRVLPYEPYDPDREFLVFSRQKEKDGVMVDTGFCDVYGPVGDISYRQINGPEMVAVYDEAEGRVQFVPGFENAYSHPLL